MGMGIRSHERCSIHDEFWFARFGVVGGGVPSRLLF